MLFIGILPVLLVIFIGRLIRNALLEGAFSGPDLANKIKELFQKAEYEKILRLLERNKKNHPFSTSAFHLIKAQCYIALNNVESALDSLEMVIDNEPFNYDARMMKIDISDFKNDIEYEQALIEFLKDFPDSPGILLRQALLNLKRQNYEIAELELVSLVKNHPQLHGSYPNLFTLYINTNQFVKAEELIKTAIKNNYPDYKTLQDRLKDLMELM